MIRRLTVGHLRVLFATIEEITGERFQECENEES